MSKKCFHCIRITVVVINFTLFLIGIAILGSSIFLYVKTSDHDVIRAPDHYSEFKKILCYIMGIGTFTIILSLVGCVGAYHESQIMLGVYFVITLLLFASEVAVGALYFVFKDDKLSSNLKISIESYKTKKITSQESLFLNSIQKMLKCCGVEGPKDFKSEDKDSPLSLPPSCCNYEKSECKPSANVDGNNAFSKGCKEQYKEFSQQKLGVISMIIIVMSIIEFLGMIFSLSLCLSIRYSDDSGYMAVKRSMVI